MFDAAQTPDPRLARYDHLIVHVTATAPDKDLDDKDIDAMHRGFGWDMCGYHALIKRDGTWLDSDTAGICTRPIGEQGAHVGGCGPDWNGRSFGVSMVGGVDACGNSEMNMTEAQFATLERGIRRFLDLHPGGAQAVTIMGHRDLIALNNAEPKDCPCFDVIPWWEATRDLPTHARV